MVVLLNTQATFLERLACSDERFARIDSELADIKEILLRHEQMLAALPDAIRDKIGFKTR